MKTFADFGIDTRGKHGEIKTVCPQCSHTRKKKSYPCLNVNTDKGLWHCWHCDWSGSLEKGEEVRANPYSWAPKIYKRPVYVPITDLPAHVVKWFGERGIPELLLAEYRINYGPVYMPQVEDEVNAIQFPYLRGGEVINVKYRDGRKNFRQSGGAEKILYGLDDMAEATIWVEGEIDKLSLAAAGLRNAVSVPDGAPDPRSKQYGSKFEFLDNCQDAIGAVQTHILAVDSDAPGRVLEEELARRLGREKCLRVQWPDDCKDANEVLVKHGAARLAECIHQARPFPLAGVFEVADFADRIDALYDHGMPGGVKLPWEALKDLYSVREGEWTLVTGMPSSGKSEFLDAMLVHLANLHDWQIAVCSPENQPLERHAAKLMQQWSGMPFREGFTRRMDPATKDAAKHFLQNHFSFILPETPTVDSVLELARVLVYRRGIKGLVIDPWNELDHSRPGNFSETEYISETLSRIRRFARENAVHVWIVAHPTKLKKDEDGNYPVATPYDVSGCHAADTEVMTSAGWVKHADVTLDHAVACFDMETNELRYEHPSKLWEFDHSGEMYRFLSPSYDALVTPNHRMVVRPSWRNRHQPVNSGKGRPFAYDREGWTFKRADEIAGDLEMPWAAPVTGGQHCGEFLGYELDGFLQFLGWWISEGWHNKGSGGLGVCQGVGPLADKMAETMRRAGISFTEAVGAPGTGGTIPGWKAYIGKRANRELCEWVPENCGIGAKNKKIPAFVWDLPLPQKALLLDALIEGDGSQGRGDTFRYTTTSRQLADDVQRLAIECGRMSCIGERPGTKANHADQYQVTIGRLDRKSISLRKARNVAIEHYEGKVYCLTVPTGAYLVRRNGKPGIYGNSAHWRNKADNAISVWRDMSDPKSQVTQIHIQKIRFAEVGKLGMAELAHDNATGRYFDLKDAVRNIAPVYAYEPGAD